MDDRARAILMVDDDEGLCELVQEFLGREGYDVTTVHDGASGLGAALEGRFVLVILDVMLPVLDGFAVLRQLRRQSNVPVIMLTARASEQDRVGGLGEGADDYLVKPFAAAELLARIRAVLRRTLQRLGSGVQRGAGRRSAGRCAQPCRVVPRCANRIDAHGIHDSRSADASRWPDRLARRARRRALSTPDYTVRTITRCARESLAAEARRLWAGPPSEPSEVRATSV